MVVVVMPHSAAPEGPEAPAAEVLGPAATGNLALAVCEDPHAVPDGTWDEKEDEIQ